MSDWIVVGCVIGVVGFVILVAVAVMVWLLHSRIASLSEKNGLETAKAAITKGSSLSDVQLRKTECGLLVYVIATMDHPTAIKAADFKKEVDKVNGLGGSAIKAYLDSVRRKRHKAFKGNPDVQRVLDAELIKCTRALHPEYEITEATQTPVVGQHIRERDHTCLSANALSDVFGRDFIIAQASTEELFEYQWEMVWQRKVGVIVWLGSTSKFFASTIKPYIGLAPDKQCVYGRFETTTTKVTRYHRMYRQYNVNVRNTHVFTTVDVRGQETRQMFVVHVDWWPKKCNKAKAEKLAVVIEMVRSLGLQQNELGLPAIMVQCSNGLEFSCTFAAIYLNRQMYLRFNAVNVKEVLKMIERVRYNAFSSSNAFKQIKLLHAVLLELMQKYPRPNIDTQSRAEPFEKHLLRPLGPRSQAASSKPKPKPKSKSTVK